MIDEAFMPFSEIISKMLSIEGEIFDDGKGIHSYIYEFEINSPLEFDIDRDIDGKVVIGSTPPIYYVDTTFRPSFHRIAFTAEKTEYNGE